MHGQGVAAAGVMNTRSNTTAQWLSRLRQGQPLYFLSDLCKLSGLGVASMRRSVQRLVQRGLLRRVGKELYWNTFLPCSIELLSGALVLPSYVSLESALYHHGIILQAPQVLTCVTSGPPRRLKTAMGSLLYQHISERYFWGYQQGDGSMATAEKAVLDYVYLSLKTGKTFSTDEWDWSEINQPLLLEYSLKFPGTVQRRALELTT